MPKPPYNILLCTFRFSNIRNNSSQIVLVVLLLYAVVRQALVLGVIMKVEDAHACPAATARSCLPHWLEALGWAVALMSDAAAAAMGRLPATPRNAYRPYSNIDIAVWFPRIAGIPPGATGMRTVAAKAYAGVAYELLRFTPRALGCTAARCPPWMPCSPAAAPGTATMLGHCHANFSTLAVIRASGSLALC